MDSQRLTELEQVEEPFLRQLEMLMQDLWGAHELVNSLL